MMSTSTGAANARKLRLEMREGGEATPAAAAPLVRPPSRAASRLGTKPRPSSSRSWRRAVRTSTKVAAHCAAVVATAAPASPRRRHVTSSKSPAMLTAVATAVATSAAAESFAPSSAAWSTPPTSDAGSESARIVTYVVAGPMSAASAAAALPTYTPRRLRPHVHTMTMETTPHTSATLAARRTTAAGSSAFAPCAASAEAYRLVVATLRNAKR